LNRRVGSRSRRELVTCRDGHGDGTAARETGRNEGPGPTVQRPPPHQLLDPFILRVDQQACLAPASLADLAHGTSAGVEILRFRVVEEPSHPFQFRTLIDRLRRRVATLIEADFDHLHLGQRSFVKHGVRGVNRHSLV
jgi:hypothetical protein